MQTHLSSQAFSSVHGSTIASEWAYSYIIISYNFRWHNMDLLYFTWRLMCKYVRRDATCMVHIAHVWAQYGAILCNGAIWCNWVTRVLISDENGVIRCYPSFLVESVSIRASRIITVGLASCTLVGSSTLCNRNRSLLAETRWKCALSSPATPWMMSVQPGNDLQNFHNLANFSVEQGTAFSCSG